MKRFLSCFLALALLLSLTFIPALADDTPTFKVVVQKHALDKSDGTAAKAGPKHAEEATGIKIEYIEVDSANVTELVNLMLASGDLPDAFISTINADQITKNQPLFVTLNNYLTPEIAPNYCAMFEKYPVLLDLITQTDGNIYTLPIGDYTNPDNQAEGIQFINKAWLDKLELEMPATTEEFYEVCKAIKEGDPNGNGIADELPITFSQNNWAAHFINFLGPWGICEWEGGGNGYLKVEDGKVIFTPTLPEFRAGLEYWHRMAAEGLLDVEGFTQTVQQYYARLKEYVAVTYRGWTPASNFDAEKAAEFVAMPALTASDYPDIKPVTPGEVNKFGANVYGIAITAACKDPAKLLGWFDAQNADTATKMLWIYGEEGILWKQDDDGKVWALWPEQTEDFTRENMKYTYGLVGHVPVLVLPEELEQNADDAPAEATVRIGLVNAVKEWFPAERFPQRSVPAEKLDERSFIEADLKAYLDSFVADAVVNGLDDAKWEAHLKTVEKYRASEWVQWYQDFVDKKF
jgi:ABC-type glycerol-3-phosphate transport system substrate-binding protein